MNSNFKSKKKSAALYIILSAALFMVLYLQNPNRPALLPCYWNELTGFDCPGCGMTRAFCNLIHGNVAASLHNNLLVVFAFPAAVFLWCDVLYFIMTGRSFHIFKRIPKKILCIMLILTITLIIAFGILRNIPAHPFDFYKV